MSLIETTARAIAAYYGDDEWGTLPTGMQERCRDEARAVLAPAVAAIRTEIEALPTVEYTGTMLRLQMVDVAAVLAVLDGGLPEGES